MTPAEQNVLIFIVAAALLFGAFTFGCIVTCEFGQCFICQFKAWGKRK